MKILEVAEFYSWLGGGVRTYVEQKFDAAHAAGHSLTVVAPGEEDEVEARRSGKLIWVKSPPIPVDKRYYLFNRQAPIDEIVGAEKPDLIEASSPWRGAWFAGCQATSIPKALVIHQEPVSTYPQTILRNFLRPKEIDKCFFWFFRYFRRLQQHFDLSVAPSAWLADRLEGVGLKRPHIVPFGITRSAFENAPRSAFLRRAMLHECGVETPHAKLLITLGRHHPEKRLPLMFEAFEAASAAEPMGLYVVGDGPNRRKIEKLAARTRGICIAGFIDDREKLAAMLASADAYIQAMPNETFGMAVAEALCAGAPVIAPAAGGILDFLSSDCAEFYRPDDVRDFAEAITRLFARDSLTLRSRVASSSGNIRDADDHFRELFALYERLVADKHGAEISDPRSATTESRLQSRPPRSLASIR